MLFLLNRILLLTLATTKGACAPSSVLETLGRHFCCYLQWFRGLRVKASDKTMVTRSGCFVPLCFLTPNIRRIGRFNKKMDPLIDPDDTPKVTRSGGFVPPVFSEPKIRRIGRFNKKMDPLTDPDETRIGPQHKKNRLIQ